MTSIDYVFFIYGLSFLLLGVLVCERRQSDLPWPWLAWFGFLHGANEWLDMFALDQGDTPVLQWTRLALMASSFVMLLEFARRGARAHGRRMPGVWIVVPLVAAGALGVFSDLNGLNAAWR